MTPAQSVELSRLARAGTTTQRLALRISIVLLAAQGRSTTAIADSLSICVDTAAKWRHRWWAAPGMSRSNDQNLWICLGGVTRLGAPSRG